MISIVDEIKEKLFSAALISQEERTSLNSTWNPQNQEFIWNTKIMAVPCNLLAYSIRFRDD